MPDALDSDSRPRPVPLESFPEVASKKLNFMVYLSRN